MSELTFAKIRTAIIDVEQQGERPQIVKLAPLDYKRFGELCTEHEAQRYPGLDIKAEFNGLRVYADDRVPTGEIWVL